MPRGRPSKTFEESSERSKRRKTENLRLNYTQELVFATQMKLRAEGESKAAKVVQNVLSVNQPNSSNLTYTQYTPDESLALVVFAKLTKFQYNLIRQGAIDHSCKMYPPYELITTARKNCYPNNMVITESSAEVPLQDLLDHTGKRLLKSLSTVLSSISEKNNVIHMVSKWGCDGTSGQSEY